MDATWRPDSVSTSRARLVIRALIGDCQGSDGRLRFTEAADANAPGPDASFAGVKESENG